MSYNVHIATTANVGIVFVLLKTTTLGLYAIAGVSSLLSIVRNLIYTVPCGAKYIGCPWHTFYPEIGKSVLSVTVVGCIGFVIKGVFNVQSWQSLCFGAMATAFVGLLLNYLLVLNGNERKYIRGKLKKRLR